MKKSTGTRWGVIPVATILACLGSAAAQESVTLKFAMAVPPGHYTAIHGGKFFMERATELSKGRIKFEWYPAQQLGKAKDMLTLVQTGVADIADVVPSYTPDKLPLTGVSELPGQSRNSCDGAQVYYTMTRPGQFLATREFDAQKVRVLMAAPLVPYKIFTSKKQVTRLEELAGLKIRSSGGASDSTVRALGAVAVNLAGPEMHQALTRGTIDGAMYPFISLRPFDLVGSIKYVAEGVSVGAVSTTFLMSQARYDKLPADLQAVIDQAGREAGVNYCNYMDTQEEKEKATLSGSITATQLSESEAARWQAILGGVKQDWAKRLEDRGKPGLEALRIWDQEMQKVRSAK